VSLGIVKKTHLPWLELDPHLIRDSLAHPTHHSICHLDRLSHFCTIHDHEQQSEQSDWLGYLICNRSHSYCIADATANNKINNTNSLVKLWMRNVQWCASCNSINVSIFVFFFGVLQTVGFVWGYVCQQFSQTILVLLAGFVLACLVGTIILIICPLWLSDANASKQGFVFFLICNFIDTFISDYNKVIFAFWVDKTFLRNW